MMVWYYVLLLVIACGLGGLLHYWPRGGVQRTFSYHAASSRAAELYYITLFIVTLPPLVYWYAVWAVPTYSLPVASAWCMAGAAIFQVAACSVPERGQRVAAHRILTALSLANMFVVVTLLLLHDYRVDVALCTAVMTAVTIYAPVARDSARYQLLLQVGTYAAFFVAIGLSLN